MGFADAIRAGFANYVTFSGRAQRSAFWYWTLFVLLGSIVAGVLDGIIFSGIGGEGNGPLNGLWGLAALLALFWADSFSIKQALTDRAGS